MRKRCYIDLADNVGKAMTRLLIPALLFSFSLLVALPHVRAQEKSDLEVTVQVPPGAVRGGESFSYTVTVRNAGTEKALDVILINDPESLISIKSAQPSVGSCKKLERPRDREMTCSFGDLSPNVEVTVVFSVEVNDFDLNESAMLAPTVAALTALVNQTASPDGAKTALQTEEPPVSIASLDVSGAEQESNDDNNHVSVRMVVRPSANRAPELEIISPQDDAVLTRTAKRRTTFAINIRAVDPDGTIDRVVVREQDSFPGTIVEDGVYKYVYQGKTYTVDEIEAVMTANPAPEKLARRTGKDTFVYTITDPPYGINPVFVEAYDNLGRHSSRSLQLTVEGDATVEIVSPSRNEVIEPGSTVTVEIVSKLNEGPLKEIALFGMGEFKPVRPQLVSKQGNVYRHRFILKTDPTGGGNRQVWATMTEESGATKTSKTVYFLVRKRPKISITSIKNGDVFSLLQSVRIAFNAVDAEPGQDYNVMVDTKNIGPIQSHEIVWRDLKPGVHVIQVIAREYEYELSRSEPITVRVK